jgi:hypothetical protein
MHRIRRNHPISSWVKAKIGLSQSHSCASCVYQTLHFLRCFLPQLPFSRPSFAARDQSQVSWPWGEYPCTWFSRPHKKWVFTSLNTLKNIGWFQVLNLTLKNVWAPDFSSPPLFDPLTAWGSSRTRIGLDLPGRQLLDALHRRVPGPLQHGAT